MLSISEKMSLGSGCFGEYYRFAKRRGVKVVGVQRYKTIEELKASESYRDAVKEAALYRLAYPSGVVPRCYGVTVIDHMGNYMPGIILQHIESVRLTDASLEYEEFDTVAKHLQKTLLDATGVRHADLHGNNILRDANGKDWAIDFTPQCASTNKELLLNSVPQYRARTKPTYAEQQMNVWQKVIQFMESRL